MAIIKLLLVTINLPAQILNLLLISLFVLLDLVKVDDLRWHHLGLLGSGLVSFSSTFLS